MPLNYTPLVRLMQEAHKRLEFPRIKVFTAAGSPIVIKLAAKGYLAIIYDGNYVGKISTGGSLVLYSDAETVSTILSQLNEDPKGFTAEQGRKHGICCFCARDLTDPASVAAGYGPVCADNFGLPWGDGTIGEREANLSENEPERVLKEIENAAVDSRIAGVRDSITTIADLIGIEVVSTETGDVIIGCLEALIRDMEAMKS